MANKLNKIKLYQYNKHDRLIFFKELATSQITDTIALQIADQILFIRINNQILKFDIMARFLLENCKLKKSTKEYLKYYFDEGKNETKKTS